MSNEIESVPLREYIEKAIEQEARLRKELDAERDNALELARENMELKLKGMDHLRDKYDELIEKLDDRVKTLEALGSNLQGRIWMGGAVIVIINFVLYLLRGK